MTNPFPSVNKAHAMLIADESQRMTAGIRINGDIPESMSLYAMKDGYSSAGGSPDLYDGEGKSVCNPTGHVSHESMAMYSSKGGYGNNSGYNSHIMEVMVLPDSRRIRN